MAKYDIEKTKKLKFARYGGLSSVNQEGYSPTPPSFHTPPAKRGIYAFVWPFIELFLLSAECTKDPRVVGSKFLYVRDTKGVIITDLHPDYVKVEASSKYWSIPNKEYTEFFDKHENMEHDERLELWNSLKLPRFYLVKKPKPRIFEYNGELWHHLGGYLKPHLIFATKGYWVKSDMASYREALHKKMHAEHRRMMGWCFTSGPNKVLPTGKTAINRSLKDELEVFIEKL